MAKPDDLVGFERVGRMKTLIAQTDTGRDARNVEAQENRKTSMHDHNLVSIIVCTRNRAEKLSRTLQAIQMLAIPAGADFEVIVVDNGSTDRTAEVCANVEGAFQGRLKRIFLESPGLSRAGNTGFGAARGSIISFLDDDVLPRRDWLEVVWRQFSGDQELGAISGQVALLNADDLPISIRRLTELTEFQSLAHAFGLFIGCNLAVRRRLIERVGLFDPDIGTGTRFGSAGDSDFFYRAWKAGEKLLYVPSLFVHHDHGRSTREARFKVSRDYIVGRGAFYAKHVLRKDGGVARASYWEFLSAWRSLFDRKDDLGWRHLVWLLKGFVGYGLMVAGRSVTRSSGRTPSSTTG